MFKGLSDGVLITCKLHKLQAWCFIRQWDINRYIVITEEALELSVFSVWAVSNFTSIREEISRYECLNADVGLIGEGYVHDIVEGHQLVLMLPD